MIKVSNLTFGYGKGQIVLNDFSLNIERGKVCGLLGANGTGKSTLLSLMMGMLTPLSGSVKFNDVETKRRLPSVLSDMFIVPEEIELPAITLDEYVKTKAVFYPNFSREDMMNNLKTFEMPADGNLKLNALSMGQKKKVYMSFALATNTSLLLMDEPTNGLDIPSKAQFRKFISAGMTDDRSIVISTHQVHDVERLLDQVIIIDNHQVLLQCQIDEISERLFFTQSNDAQLTHDAIFAIPDLYGNRLVLVNTNNKYGNSEVNLELLFGAVHANPEIIKQVFNSSNK